MAICGGKWHHFLTALSSILAHALHDMCVISNTKNCGFNGAHCDCNCSTLIPIIWSTHCVQFIYFLCSFHISSYVLYSFYLNYWAHEEQKLYAAINLRKPTLYSGCYLKCFRIIIWHFCVCTVTHFQRETNVDQQWGMWGLKQTAGTTEVLNVDPLLSI